MFRISRRRDALTWLVVVLAWAAPSAGSADWTTYRADASRSAFTSESVVPQPALTWEFRLPQSPAPAWPRDERMSFDRAPQAAAAGDRVLFGSTNNGRIYALDAKSGAIAWTFETDGPVRFAPTIWKDRAFCVSDDGWLYALRLDDGRLLWKKRGGEDAQLVLGNDHLISKWPARGAPAVVDDTVYFAAGIWPSDGIFLHALDAESGEPKWTNDSSGGIYMAQPHGGANARSGVSAQGYLVASGDKLFVPTGRAVPAVFDRATGEFLYFHLQKYGHNGGAQTMAVGDLFFNSGLGFNAASGHKVVSTPGQQIAATPDGLIRQMGAKVAGYRWVEGEKVDRRGVKTTEPTLEPLWEAEGIDGGLSLIIAGEHAICGGDDKVTRVKRGEAKADWSASIVGGAYGLAVHNGSLLVSTDAGRVYCFGAEAGDGQPVLAKGDPQVSFEENKEAARLAEQILSRTNVRAGYCVDVGCGDGALAYHLARQSRLLSAAPQDWLRIYAIEPDAAMAAEARRKLSAAGVYGQVMVHHRPLDATGYPKYLADLVVSYRQLKGESSSLPEPLVSRLQRPCGGIVCQRREGELVLDERGPLPGAGEWTHQYSTAANTLNSGDRHVKGRLTMLWYRDVAFDIPQRHGRAPAPLYSHGRLFHAGLDGLVAVDAYNGRTLWEHEVKGLLDAYDGDQLMGTAGTGSNFCVDGDSLYVRQEGRCLQLDVATGKVRQEFDTPSTIEGEPGIWGHIAAVDGKLFGSVADPEHTVTHRYVDRGGDMSKLLTESRSLFAIDTRTGAIRWRYDAKHSIRHNAIAIGSDRLFLIDRPQALFDRVKKSDEREHPFGSLVAIDTKTGKELWRNDETIYGTLLSYSAQHKTLLMSYQPTRFRLDSEIGGRMAAFDAQTGRRRWDIRANYQSRPMINDDVVYAQGGAWELLTGKPLPFDFSRSYGCGVLAGSKHMMLYRSATLGYFNFQGKQETENFGGVRPGCWINAIPAGGIVMVPDASSGCRCSYLNKTWFALDSDPRTEPVFEPNGGAAGKPIEVRVDADPAAASVRYTLDGTLPNRESPQYRQPVVISKTSRLKARAFYDDGSAGPAASAEYLVEKGLIPLDGDRWKVWDTRGPAVKSAPSDWRVQGSEVVQLANIYEGSSGEGQPADRREGTLRIYSHEEAPFRDGVLSAQIKSDDNDGIGLAFRVQSPEKLYLLALDAQRKFQVLALRDGQQHQVLDQNDIGYTPNQWHDIRIEAVGGKLTVHFDGKQVLQADDAAIDQGGIALYSWGNTGVHFRALKVAPR